MSADAPIVLSDDDEPPTPAVAPANAPPTPAAPVPMPAPAPAPAPADAPIVLSDDEDAPTPAPEPPAPEPPAPALLYEDGTRISGLYIAPSSIPGLDEPGLWTSKAIAPGGFIAIYTGRFVTESEHDRLSSAEQDAHTKYALAFKGNPILVLPGEAPDMAIHAAAVANRVIGRLKPDGFALLVQAWKLTGLKFAGSQIVPELTIVRALGEFRIREDAVVLTANLGEFVSDGFEEILIRGDYGSIRLEVDEPLGGPDCIEQGLGVAGRGPRRGKFSEHCVIPFQACE